MKVGRHKPVTVAVLTMTKDIIWVSDMSVLTFGKVIVMCFLVSVVVYFILFFFTSLEFLENII